MILGIGCDVVQIPRIEKALEEHGQAFEDRLFTQGEQAYANKRGKAGPRLKASAYAKRVAAKEAFVKALGTGFSEGINWKEIEIIHTDNGGPTMEVRGNALSFITRLTPLGLTPRIDVSLSDDYPVAQAFVVISWNA